jgi:hypothetical protein
MGFSGTGGFVSLFGMAWYGMAWLRHSPVRHCLARHYTAFIVAWGWFGRRSHGVLAWFVVSMASYNVHKTLLGAGRREDIYMG